MLRHERKMTLKYAFLGTWVADLDSNHCDSELGQCFNLHTDSMAKSLYSIPFRLKKKVKKCSQVLFQFAGSHNYRLVITHQWQQMC